MSLPAAAQPPSVTVDEAVPFSATQLADAVALRAGDAPLTVRVAREGDGIKVEVGDNAQVIAVDLQDPQAAVRVVAMVVVALSTEPQMPTPPAFAPPGMIVTPSVVAQSPAPAPAPKASRFAIRAMIGLWRVNDGEEVTSYTGAIAYRFAPTLRIVASATSENRITHEPGRWPIFRLGVEALRFEPFAIEAGILRAGWGTVNGAYVDARYYQRLGDHFRLVASLGAHFLNVDEPMPGNEAFADEPISMYLHGGLEWRL